MLVIKAKMREYSTQQGATACLATDLNQRETERSMEAVKRVNLNLNQWRGRETEERLTPTQMKRTTK